MLDSTLLPFHSLQHNISASVFGIHCNYYVYSLLTVAIHAVPNNAAVICYESTDCHGDMINATIRKSDCCTIAGGGLSYFSSGECGNCYCKLCTISSYM